VAVEKLTKPMRLVKRESQNPVVEPPSIFGILGACAAVVEISARVLRLILPVDELP
jgi:hypothetical protein